jgi:ribosomal protein S18 acetylase RimI-like enzyme
MPIVYSGARPEDLTEAARVYATAINNLDRKHGFPEGRMSPSLSDNPQFTFWIENAPRPFWVAKENGKVVGFTYSFLRGSLWFLADLFILPAYQGKGIGGNLIRKTLDSWKGYRISNRALLTPAFNRVSVSLYMRFGMLPRQPVYFADASRDKLLETKLARGLESELVEIPDVYSKLDQIHRDALGIPSGWHNEFFYRMQQAKCLLFKKNGQLEGYGIFRKNGRIGPLIVKSPSSFRSAFESTLRTVTETCSEKISILFAGTNREAVFGSIKHGFSIKYPMLFLSSKSMGDWDNYLFCSPGLM